MEETQYYRSLMRNMLLTVIAVSLAPLILISAITGYYFNVSYHEKVVAQLVELVEKHKQNIDGFLQEKLADIKVVGKAYTFAQLSNDTFLQTRLSIMQQAHSGVFVDLGVVDDLGKQVAYAGTFKLEKADYSNADWFKQAINSEYFISDVFLGIRGLPHFIVAVRQETEGKKWLLRATIDFVAFNSLVENIRVGRTGVAFILNKKGEFQTTPRREMELDREVYAEFLRRPPTVTEITRVADDYRTSVDAAWSPRDGDREVTVVERKNPLGRKLIYVMTRMKGGEWVLVYQQDVTEAFSDLYHARNIAVTVCLLGGLAIVFTAHLLSKKMVQRVAQSDREKEMVNEQVIETGKLASVGELAAGIAHEINNPVAVMVEEAGWIEDLLEEEDFQASENLDEFKRALNQIRTQGKRCKEITHKLLSFARKTDPNVKDVQVNDLIEEVVGISEQRAKYGNVKIKTNLSSHLPTITVSPSEMQQVLLNLINNAIDAMEAKGGTIELTTRLANGRVVIDVADTGQGIPKANLARIFDPFYTTKPVGKGTGLGLSICYGIIKKMDGEISVNSAVGIGTTFHVSLPLSKEQLDELRTDQIDTEQNHDDRT